VWYWRWPILRATLLCVRRKEREGKKDGKLKEQNVTKRKRQKLENRKKKTEYTVYTCIVPESQGP